MVRGMQSKQNNTFREGMLDFLQRSARAVLSAHRLNHRHLVAERSAIHRIATNPLQISGGLGNHPSFVFFQRRAVCLVELRVVLGLRGWHGRGVCFAIAVRVRRRRGRRPRRGLRARIGILRCRDRCWSGNEHRCHHHEQRG